MKKRTFALNSLLSAAVALTLLVFILVNTFAPIVILPQINIPNLVALTLLVLIAEHYLAPGAKRCYVCIALLSALTFGLLPLAAGYAAGMQALKLALIGSAVFTVTTWLFSSIVDRIQSGPEAHGALLISALSLWLASQCFTGILL